MITSNRYQNVDRRTTGRQKVDGEIAGSKRIHIDGDMPVTDRLHNSSDSFAFFGDERSRQVISRELQLGQLAVVPHSKIRISKRFHG